MKEKTHNNEDTISLPNKIWNSMQLELKSYH